MNASNVRAAVFTKAHHPVTGLTERSGGTSARIGKVILLIAGLALTGNVSGSVGEGITTQTTMSIPAPNNYQAIDPNAGVTLAPGVVSAQHGVGSSGNFEYMIPLDVAVGRRGIRPELTLQYTGGTRDDLMGRGWRLQGLSAITRCGENQIQNGRALNVTLKKTDRFCLDGAQLFQIDPVPAAYGAPSPEYGNDGVRYRTEFDPSRIVVSHGVVGSGESSSPQWFEVFEPDGRIHYYGDFSGSNASALLAGNFPASGHPLSGQYRVISWGLSQVADRDGNFMRISYRPQLSNAGAANAILLPDRIDYSGQMAADGQTVQVLENGDRSVRFTYETRPASEARIGFQFGSKYMRELRLARISSFVGESERSYWKLTYRPALAGNASGNYSLLKAVSECRQGDVCFKATELDYVESAVSVGVVRNASSVPPAVADNTYALIPGAYDVDGDGNDDVLAWKKVVSSGGAFVHVLAYGPSGIPRKSIVALSGAADSIGAQNNQVHIADVDQDGLNDLVILSRNGSNSFSYATVLRGAVPEADVPGTEFGASFLGASAVVSPIDLRKDSSGSSCAAPVLEDVDGDGFPDLFCAFFTGASLTHWVLLPGRGRELLAGQSTPQALDVSGWFLPPQKVAMDSVGSSSGTGNIGFNLADLSGDGLPELVVIWASNFTEDSSIYVYVIENNASAGTGRFSGRRSESFIAGKLSEYAFPYWGKQFFYEDANGDGIKDFLVSDGNGSVILSRGDMTFERVGALPGDSAKLRISAAIHYFDINRDGVPDQVFLSNSPRPYQYVPSQNSPYGSGTERGITLSMRMGNGDGTYEADWRKSFPAVCTDVYYSIGTDLWCGIVARTSADSAMEFINSFVAMADGSINIAVGFRAGTAARYLSGITTTNLAQFSTETFTYTIGRFDIPVSVQPQAELVKIREGSGVDIGIAYSPLNSAAGAYVVSGRSAYPGVAEIYSGLRAVTGITVTPGGSGSGGDTTNYSYENGRFHTRGRGFLGFEKTTESSDSLVTNPAGSSVQVTQREETQTSQSFPCQGSLSRLSRFVNNVQTFERTSEPAIVDGAGNPVPCTAVSDVSQTPLYRLSRVTEIEKTFNVDSADIPDDLTSTLELTRQFDSYGNVTSEDNLLWAPNTAWYRTKTDTRYKHESAAVGTDYLTAGLVHTVDSVRVEKTSPNQSPTRFVRKSWVTHDPVALHRVAGSTEQAFSLANAAAADPASSFMDFGTTASYTYDRYGNVQSTTVAASGRPIAPADSKAAPVSGSRTIETFYDAKAGSYPAGMFNTRTQQVVSKYADALERGAQYVPTTRTHVVTRDFDTVHGRTVREVRADKVLTTTEYDPFGRVTRVENYSNDQVSPQSIGSVQTERMRCTDAGTCQSGEAVRIATTKSGEAAIHVYLDKLGREARRVSKGFSGTDITVVTQYDDSGRVRCVSEPGTTGSCTGSYDQWTHTEYDMFGRVLRIYAPGNRQTTIVHDNLVVSTMTPDGVIKRQLNNLRGQPTWIGEAFTRPEESAIWYYYDAAGNLLRTVDKNNNVVQMSYDPLGRKTGMTDPDMGTWSYDYDGLGREIRQTDAKGQKTYSHYDELDRMYFREEASLRSYWQYDSANPEADAAGMGKLHWTATGSRANPDYKKLLSYDRGGRIAHVSAFLGGTQKRYRQSIMYDINGRVASLRYNDLLTNNPAPTAPDMVGYRNFYNAYGYLAKVTDYTDEGTVLWEAKTADNSGRLTSFTLGNGLTTRRTYHPALGLPTSIVTGKDIAGSSALTQLTQNAGYGYSVMGNLTTRSRYPQNVQEFFEHDSLNRLGMVTTVANGVTSGVTHRYDVLGNLTFKTDAGNYVYGAAGGCGGVHRVCRTEFAGFTLASFTYDANGNMVTGNGRTYQREDGTDGWTSFNMPLIIRKNGAREEFLYNSDYERVQHVVSDGARTTTTWYMNPRVDLGGHFEETATNNGSNTTTEYTHYIYAGGSVVGSIVTQGGGAKGWAGIPANSPPTTTNPNAAGLTLPNDPAGIFAHYQSADGAGLTIKNAVYSAAYSGVAIGQRRYQASLPVTFHARVSHPTDLWKIQQVGVGVGNDGGGGQRRSVSVMRSGATSLSLNVFDGTGVTVVPITLADATTQFTVEISTGAALTWVYVYGANGRSREDGFVWSGPIDWAAGNSRTVAFEISGGASATGSGKSVQVTALGETVGERRYFHSDHIGSIEAVTDGNGNVLEQLSYDSWGARRGVDGVNTGEMARSVLWENSALAGGGWDNTQMARLGTSKNLLWDAYASGYPGAYLVKATVAAGEERAVGTRRYLASDTVSFKAQMRPVGTWTAKAMFGVSNQGGAALRSLHVVQDAGTLAVKVRGIGGNTAEQSVPLTAFAAGQSYWIEIITGPQSSDVYVYASNASRPATPAWSTTDFDWSGGAGLTRSMEIGGIANGVSAAQMFMLSLSEARIEPRAAVQSRYTAEHGFTGHEHLEATGLIHMNGRIFDPVVARFVSADPHIAYPENTQDFNRYSYVWNNPQRNTDPSGYAVPLGLLPIINGAAYLCARYCTSAARFLDNLFSPGPTSLTGIEGSIVRQAEKIAVQAGSQGGAAARNMALVNDVPNSAVTQAAIRERVLANVSTTRAANEASNFEIHSLIEKVPKLDISTPANKAIVWSNARGGNLEIADDFIAHNPGYLRLENTPGGQYLQSKNLFERYSYEQAIRPWERLSARYADGASGEVTAFTAGASRISVFNRIELPILIQNPQVTSIRYMLPMPFKVGP